MLGIISAKLTVSSGGPEWTQIYEFVPEEKDKLSARGKIFVVLAISKKGGEIDTIALGREITSSLYEAYFGNLEQGAFEALRGAMQKTVNDFKEKLEDLEIGACSFVGGVVYSAATGGVRVIICREGALATILDSENEVVTASGYPNHGDSILVASKNFFQEISSEKIKKALAGAAPKEATQSLNLLINEEKPAGDMGLVVLQFKNEGTPFISQPGKETGQEEKTQNINKNEKMEQFKQRAKGLFKSLGKRIPRRSIYIKSAMSDEVTSQSKKVTFSAGVILLAVLVVSIGFGIRQKKISDLRKKYEGILEIAQSQVDQAISLSSVSPDTSRELFIDSELKLKQILELNVKDTKVDELQKKIEESKGAILGEFDASPTLFLDLSLLSSGFVGDAVSVSNGNVFILDKAGKRLVSINIETKKSKVVAGPSVIENAEDLAAYQDTTYILSSDGIYDVGLTKTKVIDKTWEGSAFISAFAGNMYVLDKAGNQIYRYAGQTGNGFGDKQNWLSTSTSANFSEATDWGLDGAVYVLYPNSKVLKYSLGSPQNFSVTGILPEIGNIDAFFADPDNQNIYLLDTAGKRVVVVDKKGKYIAQYTNDQISTAKTLVVSEAQKKILLLSGDKLLSIELKHN